MDMLIFYILIAVVGLGLLVHVMLELTGGYGKMRGKSKPRKTSAQKKTVKKSGGEKKAQGEDFDPWLNASVTEEKIRALIKVRIRFIGNVVPAVPDLSSLLESMAKTDLQKAALKRIWAEEAKEYLDEQEKLSVSGKKSLNDSLL